MTEPATCPACDRPQADGLLCHHCTSRLRDDLSALPGHMAELHTTYRRQARQGEAGGHGRTHDVPLPYDHDAATVRDSVINTIGTWIRELSFGDDRNLAPNIRAWCRWLIDRIERIRGHQAAAEIVDEIHYAAGIARQAIDRAGDSVYCGKCQICGHELWASPEVDEGLCRSCWIIGTETKYPVPGRLIGQRFWKRAETELLTRAQVLEALPYYGLDVPASTFRSWIHRGQLQPQQYQRNGKPLYLLRNAIDLARAAALTPDQSKETMTG